MACACSKKTRKGGVLPQKSITPPAVKTAPPTVLKKDR